jgi:hypothetical protein
MAIQPLLRRTPSRSLVEIVPIRITYGGRQQMQALPEKDLMRIKLDPLASVCVARGALPRLMEMREALAREFQPFDIVNLDGWLSRCANSCWPRSRC